MQGFTRLFYLYKHVKEIRNLFGEFGIDFVPDMEKCHPFVIHRSVIGDAIDDIESVGGEVELSYSAPFDYFSIEVINPDGSLSVWGMGNKTRDGHDIGLQCLVVTPGYIVILLTTQFDERGVMIHTRENIGNYGMAIDPEDFNPDEFYDFLYFTTDLIQKRRTLGRETVNKTFSCRVGKKVKRFVRDTVFIIAGREDRRSFGTRKVDWSHRWEVRGHWRYYRTPGFIGYNEAGEYCEEGRTWIRASEKGKGDMVKKSRVVR